MKMEVTNLKPSVLARFWSKVDQSGGPDVCWPWTAGKYKSGYGQFSVRAGERVKSFRAHKVAYIDSVGPIPDGMTGAGQSVCRPITRTYVS